MSRFHALGVLDDGEHADWHARLLAAEAPGLDDPAPPSGCDVAYPIEIPPETEEEAAEDAAAEAAWEARPTAARVERVVVVSTERHAGLAIVALRVHEDATSLHFHFLGGHAPSEASQSRSPRVFSELVEGLEPPMLRDDPRHRLQPRRLPPDLGLGGGRDARRGAPPGRHWRLALRARAPAEATAFFAEQGSERWPLTAAP
jgi:hypothetical protein